MPDIVPLAAAVSNAGALGMVTLTWSADPAAVVRETAALTSRPFGGNFVLTEDHHRDLDQALEAGLRIVSFFMGDPASYVGPVHDAGGLVMHTVGTAEEARRAVASGVDVIVAQGWEAGGDVGGTIATLPLVPAVVAAVAPVPVIAAGGIADARGVAAVLSLGAQAAWIGTRFLLAAEANVHADYRARLVAAHPGDPVHTAAFGGGWPDAPPRVLRNASLTAWENAGRPAPPRRPGEGDVVATAPNGSALTRYHMAMPQTGTNGHVEAMALYAGEGGGLAHA